MFFFHPLWLVIVGPALLFALWATARVKINFNKYAKVGVRSGMTGAEAAAAVVRAGGGPDVTIEEYPGFLSDHYDPRSKTLRLSPDVYRGRSISAIAVAAHEAGHSIQDAKNYAMLGIRSSLVPVVMIGSNAWMWIFLAGVFFAGSGLGWLQDVGIILFAGTVLFQLVTLPVEFDASRRAKAVLATTGIVSTQEEAKGVEKVLGAAAMTYVAGLITAVATLIYLLMIRRD